MCYRQLHSHFCLQPTVATFTGLVEVSFLPKRLLYYLFKQDCIDGQFSVEYFKLFRFVSTT